MTEFSIAGRATQEAQLVAAASKQSPSSSPSARGTRGAVLLLNPILNSRHGYVLKVSPS